METIKLKVTSGVLAHTQLSGNENQKQIALSCPTGSLRAKIEQAGNNHHLNITLENNVSLELGDTSAIWFSHNQNHEKEFMTLFNFFSLFPGKEFEFLCCIDS